MKRNKLDVIGEAMFGVMGISGLIAGAAFFVLMTSFAVRAAVAIWF